MTARTIFDLILAVLFIVAAWRIGVAAYTGRRAIRVFRIYGAVVACGWATFYTVAAFNYHCNIVDPHAWVNFGRAIQYFTVSLFLVWGFLFNEEKWARMTNDDT